ncbi:MAG: ATP-binding protein [Gammaproteobacteria bacterium]
MRFSIKYKLFIALLIATSTVVICMFLFMQWSFDRGFLNYVNTVELEFQDNLVKTLEESYAEEGSWEFLHGNQRRWRELLLSTVFKGRQENEPPILSAERLEKLHQSKDLRKLPGRSRMFRPRAVLLDKDKNLIIGNPEHLERMEFREIDFKNKVVGYLGFRPHKKLNDIHDLRFVEQQTRAFSLIALAMIIISAILALLLTRHLTEPIKKLTYATKRLTSGEYKTRISEISKDELGQLSRDFNILAKTLEHNEQARRQWIADISHELRTPISILRGEIEALQDGIREMNQQTLGSLHNDVSQLNRLVDDLYQLSISDIGALNYRKEDIDLIGILNQSIDLFREEFAQKSLNIEIEQLTRNHPLVFADPDRLQQLFTNILTNTLRYTNAGGKLKITTEVTGNNHAMHFQDTAPGIDKNHIPKLFDRLYRLETSSIRQSGGTGLGMAICKNIVDAHDGNISAQPSPLGGLWITVELPVNH